MTNPRWQIICFCILLIFPSVLGAEVICLSQNTLWQNGNWVSEKAEVQMGVMGGFDFLFSRAPLASGNLNLGDYFGYQRVFYQKAESISELRFHLKLLEGQYLFIHFAKSNDDSFAIRLSRNSLFPSAFLRLKRERILEEKAFPTQLSREQEVYLSFSGTNLSLKKNESLLLEIPWIARSGQWGFSSGLTGAVIDDVFMRSNSGEVFSEDFSLREQWLNIFFSLYFSFFICFLLASLSKAYLHRYALGILALTLFFTVFYIADASFLSHLHIDPKTQVIKTSFGDPRSVLPMMERVRFRIFRVLASPWLAEQPYPQRDAIIWNGPFFCATNIGCHNHIEEKKAGNAFKILLMGSSQTVGAGAKEWNDALFVRLYQKLQLLYGSSKIELLNYSLSGATADEVFSAYKGSNISFRPDLAILNFSYNDHSLLFAKNVSDFVDNLGTKILLVGEAASPEISLEERARLHKNHLALQGIRNANFFSAYDYFQSPKTIRMGLLWWDSVHLTSLGQELWAEELSAQVQNLLGKSK